MKRALFCVAGFFTLIGCRGPLTAPAMRRLDPDEQAQCNTMWNNMLVKPDRLDRDLLLDTVLLFEMHQVGVDRATYHAEKDYAGGVVVMDMSYDRTKPLEDWFFVDIRDHANHSLRKEHYSGDEIWSHYNNLLGITFSASTTKPTIGPAQPATQPATQPTEVQLREQWMAVRLQQIMAATQPVQPLP